MTMWESIKRLSQKIRRSTIMSLIMKTSIVSFVRVECTLLQFLEPLASFFGKHIDNNNEGADNKQGNKL